MGKVNLRLKSLIFEKWPTISDLAEEAQLNPASLSRIIHRRRPPSARELAALEKFLGKDRLHKALNSAD